MRFASWLSRHPRRARGGARGRPAARGLDRLGPGPKRRRHASPSLLWTLPLLLRHRFPFAAPAFVFAVQAASSFLATRRPSEARTPGFAARVPRVLGRRRLQREKPGDRRRGDRLRQHRGHRAPGTSASTPSTRSRRGRLHRGGVCLVAFALRAPRPSAPRASRSGRRCSSANAKKRARAAVAAERARIARDLHDVIAHSVSVMTVQAGAARCSSTRNPRARARAAARRRGDRPPGARRDAPPVRDPARGNEGDAALAPQPGLADLDALIEQAREAGLPVELTVEGRAPRAAARSRPRRLPDRPGGAHERAQARPPRARAGDDPLRPRRARPRDHERWASASETARAAATASSACASESRSTEASSRPGPRAEGGYAVRARLPVEAESRRDPRPDRRRPSARARRLPHDPRRAEGHRGRRRGERRARGARQGARARTRRRPDGHPHARAGRTGGDAPAAERRRLGACAHAHDLRPGRIRVRGDEGGSERVPAQGRSPRAARRGGARRRGRRRPARPGDHPPPDRGVRAPAAARAPARRPSSASSPSASSRC